MMCINFSIQEIASSITGQRIRYILCEARAACVVMNHTSTIPLSLDSFGLFSSSPSPPSIAIDVPLSRPRAKFFASELLSEQHSSLVLLGRKERLTGLNVASRRTSSCFLLDSIDEGANNRACTSLTLNTIKRTTSLWERSRKTSISFVSGSSPATQAGSGDSSQLLPPVLSLPSASRTSTPRPLTPVPSSAPRELVASSAFPSGRHPPKAPYYDSDTPSLSTSRLRQLHSSPSINTMIFTQWPHCPCNTIALVGPGSSSLALASCLHCLFCIARRSGPHATTDGNDNRKGEGRSTKVNTQIQAHGQLCQLTGTRLAWGMEVLIMGREHSIPVQCLVPQSGIVTIL